MRTMGTVSGEMLHTPGSQTGLGVYRGLENHQRCDLGKELNLAEAGSPSRNRASAEDPGLGTCPRGAHKRCLKGDEGRIIAQGKAHLY